MAAPRGGRGGAGGARAGPVYDVTALLSAVEAIVASRVVSSFLARRSGAWEEGGRVYVDESGLKVILDFVSVYEHAIRVRTGRAAVDLVSPANDEAKRRLERIKTNARAGGASRAPPGLEGFVDGIGSREYGEVLRVAEEAMAGGEPVSSEVLLLSGGPGNVKVLLRHAEARAPRSSGIVIVVSAFEPGNGRTYVFYITVSSGLVRGIAASVIPGSPLHGYEALKKLEGIQGAVHVKVYRQS